MLSVIIYSLIILFLVFWVEGTMPALNNSLIIRRNAGEELDEWLKRFHWGNRQEVSEKRDLPLYKFYSEVIETLLSLARKMGGSYQDSFLFLREGLQADRQFEKKLKEITTGLWLQMLMMMGLTWAFIFGALSIVEISVSPVKLLMIGGWQMTGLSLLPFLLRYLQQKLFGDIGLLWKMLYVLSSLARVPLSRSEIFQMAEVQKLKTIKQKNLSHLVDKLKDICEKALKLGGSYEDEVRYLMEELRFQEKWYFELFEKRLIVIKLLLLSVFFLPSYLAFIFLLLGDLMKLM